MCNNVCVIMLYNNMCKIFIGKIPDKNMSMRAIIGICKLHNLKFILLFSLSSVQIILLLFEV